mgnify:CR=1 FL=1
MSKGIAIRVLAMLILCVYIAGLLLIAFWPLFKSHKVAQCYEELKQKMGSLLLEGVNERIVREIEIPSCVEWLEGPCVNLTFVCSEGGVSHWEYKYRLCISYKGITFDEKDMCYTSEEDSMFINTTKGRKFGGKFYKVESFRRVLKFIDETEVSDFCKQKEYITVECGEAYPAP